MLAVGVFLVIACGAFYCDDNPERPNVGAGCGADAGACHTDLLCEEDVPGGYCTAECATPGSTTECPVGASGESVCDSLHTSHPYVCLQVCAQPAECRPDLQCAAVDGSSLMACKPPP